MGGKPRRTPAPLSSVGTKSLSDVYKATAGENLDTSFSMTAKEYDDAGRIMARGFAEEFSKSMIELGITDLVHVAIIEACELFEPGGEIFNAAGFSVSFRKLAKVKSLLDGELVRAILSGRPDGRFHGKNSAHYSLIKKEDASE